MLGRFISNSGALVVGKVGDNLSFAGNTVNPQKWSLNMKMKTAFSLRSIYYSQMFEFQESTPGLTCVR